MSRKTLIIVQARTGSTRLPGKVLMEIAGRPLLSWLLERLRRVKGADGVVLATTRLAGDDPVADLARALDVPVHRGPEQDVLGRYVEAAARFGAGHVVRVCADNPLTDPDTIDGCLRQYHQEDLDYLHAFQDVQVPYGTGCAVFSRALLERCAAATADPHDREHVEPWMLRARGVRRAAFEAPPYLRRPEIHLSVDYPSDLAKVKRVFEACLAEDPAFGTREVIRFLDRCPLVVCANASLGLSAVRHLVARGEEIRGLVVHPAARARHRAAIIEASGLSGEDILAPDDFASDAVYRWFRERDPELVASFWSSHLFTPRLLAVPPRGTINLHNSLLPWCRGSGANVWTILEGCPGGVSLHYMNEAVDRGGLIAQEPVPVTSTDTGGSLFARLEARLFDLFRREWPRIRCGPVRTTAQVGRGSFHYHASADRERELDLDAPTTARALLNRLRAFSFPPHEGAWFRDERGRRVALRLELKAIEEPAAGASAPPKEAETQSS